MTRFFLLLIPVLLAAPLARGAELLADVVVYGAGEAGCAAAVAAAREDASVILLAPDQHLGGMMTSGVCALDRRPLQTSALAGLGREWTWRVEQDYRQRGLAPENEHALAFEPHAALRVTRQMLDDAGVLLLAGRRLQAVTMDGPRLLRLHTSAGDFKGKVFIDASREGDLAARCGLRLLSPQDDDPETAAAPTDPLPPTPDEPAAPPPLPEPGSETLPFRLCLTADEANRAPLPLPADPDPLRLEDLRHWLARQTKPEPFWQSQPLPGGKSEIRFEDSGPLADYFHAPERWHDLDAAGRAALWEEQRQRMLALCHFLANDPAVPEAWRRQWSRLGLPRDEFPGNAHWPPLLPLRPGRRLAGAWVLSGPETLTGAGREEAIALCASAIAGEADDRSPWPVPLRALLPVMEECENLLAPATPSCAREIAPALQAGLMPMALGQAAGIAAALACREEEVLPLHALAYPELRARLRAQGVVLEPPLPPPAAAAPALPGIVLDDNAAELHGPWRFSSHLKPHHGKGYRHDGRRAGGDCRAVYRFAVEETARYDLLLAYTAGRDRATNVPVIIETGGRQARLLFDQTQPPPAGAPFRRLATLDLQAGEPVTVTLSNRGADGYVVIDGLQVIKSADKPASPE